MLAIAVLLAVVSLVGRWLGLDDQGRQRLGEPDWAGPARVIDGDSIVVDGIEVRLQGIDAPEGRQACRRQGKEWDCGEEARRVLQKIIAGQRVFCHAVKEDQHHRALAVCRVGDMELNREMVRQGFAVSYPSYRQEEHEAKAGKLGLWSGEFEQPRDWRRQNGISN